MDKKRLIDADAWDAFYKERTADLESYNHYDMGYEDAMDNVDDWIDAQPTIDAVEVVHGRWVEHKDPIPWCEDDADVFYRCSACGICAPGETNYCPNCGAKMDGKDDT